MHVRPKYKLRVDKIRRHAQLLRDEVAGSKNKTSSLPWSLLFVLSYMHKGSAIVILGTLKLSCLHEQLISFLKLLSFCQIDHMRGPRVENRYYHVCEPTYLIGKHRTSHNVTDKNPCVTRVLSY